MLSLPVTFLEDSDLSNGLASRDSGPKRRRELLEYRERADGILEETRVSFSGSPSSTGQYAWSSSTKRSCRIIENLCYPFPSLASALTSLNEEDELQSIIGGQSREKRAKEAWTRAMKSWERSANGGRGWARLTSLRRKGLELAGNFLQ